MGTTAPVTFVRVVAANCSLGTQLKASEPARPYTFFGAKTAGTFMQLNVELQVRFRLTRWPRRKR